MACRPSYQGSRLCMDCLTCGLGLGTPQCLNSHLRTISTLESPWKVMRYEEEMIIDLNEEDSAVFLEYVGIVRQVEQILLNKEIYGLESDDHYEERRKLLKEFYETMFQNPRLAAQMLKDYAEPLPDRQVFLEGYKTFRSWLNGILDVYLKSRLYLLSLQGEDLRQTFLSLLKLKSMPYAQSFVKSVPPNAVLIEGGEYDLPFGIHVKIYEVAGADSFLYTQADPAEDLPPELTHLLADAISDELKAVKENADYTTIFDSKLRIFRQKFLDYASAHNIRITPGQATAMAREAASWTVGLGSPIENLALDRDNLTDIYLDAENAPLYIEHQKFGLCHTLWQYNHEMLERAFRNIVATLGGSRRFDKDNPVVDVVLTRLSMRCHLQRPPATFGDLQAALRIMKEQPFTYCEYLKYKSFTPFFAGYDDMMVGLGCSEAVLGLKGVGKTAFTSAKISAINTKRRILPIQDIEEIPVRAYRKRGFHIGAVRVASSDKEDVGAQSSELDLVSMTNASLRMGDACVIINEIRSRTAIQGVINMLNTQPGIFLLYNLHAQSLKDIQDRLELVFGMPAASMYSTDRYSFLKKVRFGRKSRVYRMLGSQYETDLDKHQFVPVFTLARGDDIEKTRLACNFCELPEANSPELSKSDLGSIAKRLKLKFVPPALKRRSDETGLSVEDYVMEAFYKGKLYDLIYHASLEYDDPDLIELDFTLKCLNAANLILKTHSGQEPDWSAYDKEMMARFDEILQAELDERTENLKVTGQRSKSSTQAALTKSQTQSSARMAGKARTKPSARSSSAEAGASSPASKAGASSPQASKSATRKSRASASSSRSPLVPDEVLDAPEEENSVKDAGPGEEVPLSSDEEETSGGPSSEEGGESGR